MEFDDGLEDEPSVFRTPPLPDDRIWRHPSELAPAGGYEARPWTIAVVAGMVGALLASGSVADLKVGQPAIAIGSPLGLAGGPSVTVGVVSALHRRIEARSGPPLLDMIQTDAPISPGSSGGALLDADGAVIGITTAVAVSEVGAEGLGFATPIDLARSAAEQLIATGKVVHVWLGVAGTDLDPDTAGDLHIDGGALVGQVVDGSPAAKAGLTARDVIVAVDGKTVTTMGALVVELRRR